jgi:hypothetical protein
MGSSIHFEWYYDKFFPPSRQLGFQENALSGCRRFEVSRPSVFQKLCPFTPESHFAIF